MNRGNWLKDHNTLKDYKFENNLTVMVTPSKNLDDPNFIGPRLPTNAPIPLPKSNK